MSLSPETSLNERPVSYICRILCIAATPESSLILKSTATRIAQTYCFIMLTHESHSQSCQYAIRQAVHPGERATGDHGHDFIDTGRIARQASL